MGNLKSDKNRGDEALALQRQVGPILEDMRQVVYKQIGNSSFFQKAQREEGYKMLRAIELFESRLKKRISDGTLAKSKLKIAG